MSSAVRFLNCLVPGWIDIELMARSMKGGYAKGADQ